MSGQRSGHVGVCGDLNYLGCMWVALAAAYHLLSRLAYVVGVGVALRRQDREQIFTRKHGPEGGFLRFKRTASIVMNNDAASFVLLCLVTRQTLDPPWSWTVSLALGILLAFLGLGIKLWAAARLGAPAYYWHNFFVPGELVMPDPPGPYRYLRNPMYTLGYLHAYGFALATESGLGLAAAAFDQVAILAFHQWVEKPHFEALMQRTQQRMAPNAAPPGA
jgi:protein-S-isoprenylcysteine O-methyltransferase Ste14